jgi:putative ABC transport system permease protein
MNLLFKIAWRNIVRNRRRSLMTASAIGAGALAMLLFAGYTNFIFTGLETGYVQRDGHLTVFRSGYFLYGAGNAAAYGIDDYRGVMRLIAEDPALQPLIAVITPTQALVGIAANYSGDVAASRTFIGVGLVPSDRDRMRRWDAHGTGDVYAPDARLSDADPNRGLIGAGLARILGLCTALGLNHCPPAPAGSPAVPTAGSAPTVNSEIAALARRALGEDTQGAATRAPITPQIDLLAATVGGAPNVVSLNVSGALAIGTKELDDAYIVMHLALAQQLVYGRNDQKVTAIMVQLHRTEQLGAARARLNALFQQHHLDLEVRDFAELTPYYGQVIGLFSGIFLFISLVMGMIVLFAVVNTMTMNVMERTNEIGTIRAMGVRRTRIRLQFIIEGVLIGATGATIGAILAIVIGDLTNHIGLTWVPPGNTTPIPLRLVVLGRPWLIVEAWLGLVLIAAIAALIPANRAARLAVVDALRHV